MERLSVCVFKTPLKRSARSKHSHTQPNQTKPSHTPSHEKVRAHVEAQINLVAQGQARREAVVAHTLEQFRWGG